MKRKYLGPFILFLLPLLLLAGSGPHIAGGGGGTGAPSTIAPGALSWGIQRIQAPQAWTKTTGSRNVIVAVIDSGIDTSAPQLSGKIWTNPGEIPGNGIDDDHDGYVDDVHGWDFVDNDNSSLTGSKICWHGTFVAGIIAAQPGTDLAAGVAPGIRIMDLRVLDSKNLFYSSDWGELVAAVNFAVNHGANIINLSIYFNEKPPFAFEQALDNAVRHGVIVVGIAGNNRSPEVCYPGRLSSVLAVSATDKQNQLASFSNYGPQVAVAAPGQNVVSIFPGGVVGTGSGTSFAAPYVSGTLALILSSHPGISAPQAISLLEQTCTSLGSATRFGAGLIDAAGAVGDRS